MALLEIKNLNARYEDGQVLNNINLELEQGEILCVVGESGSGKSSLTRALTGYSGLEITGGAIEFCGRDLIGISDKERAALMGREIGLIPQNPAGSFNPIRPFNKQLKELLVSHGCSMDVERIAAAFNAVGLDDYKRILKARPYEMSGGMNQRVAIAAALILAPKLIICDEATSALDVTTAQMVIDELKDIRGKFNASILMITHNLGIAKHMADRIVIMYNGRIVETGVTKQIIESPKHEYTKRLIGSAPRMD